MLCWGSFSLLHSSDFSTLGILVSWSCSSVLGSQEARQRECVQTRCYKARTAGSQHITHVHSRGKHHSYFLSVFRVLMCWCQFCVAAILTVCKMDSWQNSMNKKPFLEFFTSKVVCIQCNASSKLLVRISKRWAQNKICSILKVNC